MPEAFGKQPGWVPRAPRSIVAMPAAAREDLRGRRVIVGLPGYGWRGDLRADEKVVQGSRTFVPVIPEQEWYKAEAEQIEVFAPLVPADRVWVEVLASPEQPPPDTASRLVSLDAPPRHDPVPIADAIRVTGRRVVQVVDGVERRDLRAVTEMFTSADGDVCLRIATELEWYRWAWSGQSPRTLEISTRLLWLE
ncbi:hypothetical protein [Micromonospora sp. CPCC 206061]|uniref:hypothetical protein n=1 Tax=Micromonospora sp. CPCC 206061 TaxID=3122410 RepID=UPI002FF2BBF2